jgi:hypothetical protein
MEETRDLAPTRLADQLERGFQGGAWHGPALMEILAGVEAGTAQWRPGPAVHSIAEIVGHLAFWLKDAHHQTTGVPREPAGLGADWGPAELGSEADWRALLARLEDAHCGLRDAVLHLSEERLDEAHSGSETSLRGVLLGVLQHNAYHAGQMALVRKLAGLGGGGQP